jgi:hypothetical protein
MMRFIVEGTSFFAPGMVLQPGHLPPALEPEALSKFSELRVSSVIHAAAAGAIARGTVPLLSFTDFVGRMSALNDHFRPPLLRDPETFTAPHPSSQAPSGAWPKLSQ